MTYAEYLQSQGASAEEVKILDTAIGRKTYEAMVAAQSEVATAKQHERDYFDQMNTWHEGQEKDFKTVESQLLAAKANEAKAVAALKTAHERGMIDVVKDLGYDFTTPAAPVKKDEPPPVDTSKFVTHESVLALAEKEAESIALMSDIAAEHVYLFGKPLRNARELRKEAMTRKVSLEQVWQEKYGVVKARADKEAAEQKAHDDALIKQGREEATAEFASRYANPDTRPLAPSTNFLTPRPTTGRDKQPWDAGFDGEGGSNDRVRRATQNALKAVTH